ncbi:hypothetical protein BLA13014_05286 [Burkholderia aenigmatica]|uniref:Uncharacterized protein n=1 Tax=Burkholderia aenigmatica TaxID=2015348 RepID=A0A6P2PYK5_9BURK|nr:MULTISPECIES: hypothetical protein [Burkholderia]MDN7516371.1 hypothetical protein [Burkholderia sp. AU45251]VWC12412.1 hypothetical protein BLA13014_05286 [Burkholderia aenigmatica]HDR9484111.1 hypothetical protein [Burkholderia aenigmatica]HDR9515076.1 hypothetical protein [Burkholderia aenigmatica]HDR9592161.1 hypothetical protein [Burkholderia aenigmatica]
MQQQTGATSARRSAPPARARRCGEAGRSRMAVDTMAFAAHAARAGKAGA